MFFEESGRKGIQPRGVGGEVTVQVRTDGRMIVYRQSLVSATHGSDSSVANYPQEATLCPDSICCHSAVSVDAVEKKKNPIWLLEIEGITLAKQDSEGGKERRDRWI